MDEAAGTIGSFDTLMLAEGDFLKIDRLISMISVC